MELPAYKPAHFSSDAEDETAFMEGARGGGGLINSQFVSRPVFQLLLSNRSPYN